MIQEGSTYWVEHHELVNPACLAQAAYESAVRAGQVHEVRPTGSAAAVVAWHTLPPALQAMVAAHLGGQPDEVMAVQAVEGWLESDPQDEAFLQDYRSANGLGLTEDNRRRLLLAARLLALLATVDALLHEGESEAVRDQYGMGVLELKRLTLAWVKLNKDKLPGKFPTTFSRLETRKRLYLAARREGKAGASSLIHGNAGNSNAGKLPDELQQQVLLRVASRQQNHSLRRTALDYNAIAATRGWQPLAPNTVRRFLADGGKGRTATIYAKGGAAYHNKYNIVVRRSAPTQPLYMWVHDATDYELLFQKETLGKRTYHHRKKVCVVVDPHSGYPVGYAIGETDTIELTQEAFRNAVRHLRELTGGYALPHQVQSDRMGWKALGEWYGAMGIKYTPARRKNARSKVIEPWFAQHNDHYANRHANWSGHNVTAKLTNQPNPDALDMGRKDFPNEASVVEQIHEDMARHRADLLERFQAALKAIPEGELRRLDRTGFLAQLGLEHPWNNELTNRGLCPTLLGEERVYQLLERGFQDRIGAGFRVLYDPADLSDVLATDTTDGKRRWLVPEFRPVPMALKDHTAESRAQLAQLEAFKLEMSQEAIDQVLNNQDRLSELADALLADALPKLNRYGHPPVDERTPARTSPEEEVVRKNYLTQGGSHKAALATATAEAQRRANIERWAEDNL